jgi:hypothetical protein
MDLLSPRQKCLSKIKIILHISRCHKGWCFQMQTIASMYMIGGWKLLSLQNYVKNVHYIQFYLHLNPHLGENLF